MVVKLLLAEANLNVHHNTRKNTISVTETEERQHIGPDEMPPKTAKTHADPDVTETRNPRKSGGQSRQLQAAPGVPTAPSSPALQAQPRSGRALLLSSSARTNPARAARRAPNHSRISLGSHFARQLPQSRHGGHRLV